MLYAALVVLGADGEGHDEKARLDEAVAACKRGEALALEVRLPEAVEAFEESLVAFAGAASNPNDVILWARCLIELGAAELARKNPKAAEAAFRRAIAIAPSVAPDAQLHNPGVVTSYKRAAAELGRAIRGTLTVIAQPTGASITLDGATVGTTSASIDGIVPGEHLLVVTHAGHQPFRSVVSVASATTSRSEVFLQPRPGPAAPRPELLPPTVIQAQPSAVSPVVALLPFGVAQFAERRVAIGTALLVSEVALLATNLISAGIVLADQNPDGTFNTPDRNATLKVINLGAAAMLAAVVIAGGVDGWLHREVAP